LEFNVPFQHKYGYIKRSGVQSYPYPVNEGQQYIKFNLGRLFVQKRYREAHLNHYASAYKTQLNQIQQNIKINLN